MHHKALIRPILLTALWTWIASFALFGQSGARPVHVVQPGETMYRISVLHGVTLEELYLLNPDSRKSISPGQKIILPTAAKNVTHYSSAAASEGAESAAASVKEGQEKARTHTVSAGETLYSLARLYGVTVEDLMAANPDLTSSSGLPLGFRLRIPSAPQAAAAKTKTPPPATAPVAPTEQVTGMRLMEVKPGMTMYSLLRATGWTEETFYTYNPRVKKEGLKYGMTIFVPDTSLPDNKAVTGSRLPGSYPGSGFDDYADVPNLFANATVVLALPFAEDGTNPRFRDYYQGFLLKLLEVKAKGVSLDLYTVDVSGAHLSGAIAEIEALPVVDWIVGGVSQSSQEALAATARQKGALYTIPFTSTPIRFTAGNGTGSVYQINTPHVRLYAAAADKFVQVYGGGSSHVHFVSYAGESKDDKSAFVTELRRTLDRSGISYSEGSSGTLDADLQAFKSRTGKVVVIPTSSSLSAADLLLKALSRAMEPAAEGETYSGPLFTAFGYPEWQTYLNYIRAALHRTESTFYTTFFTDPGSPDYKAFQSDYISWYGVSIGNTYPRYSILGYDTAGYFLDPASSGNIYKEGRYDGVYDGIQSRFSFRPSPVVNGLLSNMGVFFVHYPKGANTTVKL